MKIILTEQNFRDLVSGKEITVKGFNGIEHTEAKIILQDIGYIRMIEIIATEDPRT